MKRVKVEFLIPEDWGLDAYEIANLFEFSNIRLSRNHDWQNSFKVRADVVFQSEADYKRDLPTQIILSEKVSDS